MRQVFYRHELHVHKLSLGIYVLEEISTVLSSMGRKQTASTKGKWMYSTSQRFERTFSINVFILCTYIVNEHRLKEHKESCSKLRSDHWNSMSLTGQGVSSPAESWGRLIHQNQLKKKTKNLTAEVKRVYYEVSELMAAHRYRHNNSSVN